MTTLQLVVADDIAVAVAGTAGTAAAEHIVVALAVGDADNAVLGDGKPAADFAVAAVGRFRGNPRCSMQHWIHVHHLTVKENLAQGY